MVGLIPTIHNWNRASWNLGKTESDEFTLTQGVPKISLVWTYLGILRYNRFYKVSEQKKHKIQRVGIYVSRKFLFSSCNISVRPLHLIKITGFHWRQRELDVFHGLGLSINYSISYRRYGIRTNWSSVWHIQFVLGLRKTLLVKKVWMKLTQIEREENLKITGTSFVFTSYSNHFH